jgi:hypothetical protein
MAAPRLVFDETRWVWRVEYAGMVREHQQYWQALVMYELAWQGHHGSLDKAPPAAN